MSSNLIHKGKPQLSDPHSLKIEEKLVNSNTKDN